jgi:DNA-directed RNA polymerase subunit omega
LREIADETVPHRDLEDSLVKGLQKFVESDEPEEDEMDLLAIQQELGISAGDAPVQTVTEEDSVDEDAGDDATDEDATEPDIDAEGEDESL